MNQYLIHIAIICLYYSIVSMGQLIVMGWGALFSLAQIALCAVGAYAFALLAADSGKSFWVIFLCAPLVSVAVSVPLIFISQRLKTDYFAIGSLAFALVIQSILINWRSVTHGVLGIAGIPRPTIGGMTLDDNLHFLFFVLIVWLACFAVVTLLRLSVFKLFLGTQSEFEESLYSLGVNAGQIRMAAFIIGALFAGIGGVISASYISFIDPSSFALSEMIFVLSILILSGMHSQYMLFASTIFLVAVPELLRFVDVPSSILGSFRQCMYAFILFVTVYMRRHRIFLLVGSL